MDRHKRRIALLGRLARLREVERHGAAASAAEAHGAHSKLSLLYARSGEIAASHATRADAASGAELAGQVGFLAGLDAIMRDTRLAEVEAARLSERALLRLREADKRRERVSERLSAEKKAAETAQLTRDSAASAILARKLKGA